MGHSASLPLGPPSSSLPLSSTFASDLPRNSGQLTTESPPLPGAAAAAAISLDPPRDLSLNLPDDCLALIFQPLLSADRNRCSLVCRRWLTVDAQSRHRLILSASADLLVVSPTLFTRFNALTNLTLRCPRGSDGITDDDLGLISARCPNLTRIKLRSCRSLTESGMHALAIHLPNLRKLCCVSCTVGATGINAVLRNCPLLEEISIKRLLGGAATDILIGSPSLRAIYLKELHNGHCYVPLIVGSPNLQNLKLSSCSGNLDYLLSDITSSITGLSALHLEKLQISDRSISAFSSCVNLNTLHFIKIPGCTDGGFVAIVQKYHLLRKIHIHSWIAHDGIGDYGLMAVGRHCPNLQELLLIGVNPTRLSLELIATNCRKLERLALCGSETFGDIEMSCIATKCVALKKLCIKSCQVSDRGLETIIDGFPNLVKVKVKKCKWVTVEGVDWLRLSRASLAIDFELMRQSL